MSDYTDEEWNYAGSMLAAAYFVGPMLAIALLAIQAFMVIYGHSVFSNTPKHERKGRIPFILASWAILVACSINVLLSTWESYWKLYVGGPTGKSYALPQESPKTYSRMSIAGDAFLCITIAFGDILMLWRCFELWRDKKWIVIPPFLACIGSIVSLSISLAPFGYTNDAYSRIRAIIASASMSVAMNIMVTGLILFRLLEVWLVRRKAFSGQKSYMYSKVVVIVVESAAPLALCGIVFITTTAVWFYKAPADLRRQADLIFTREVFNWLYYSFCALSPQMIIFRVTTGKSWRNAKERNDEEAAVSQPIQFTGSNTASQTSTFTNSV